MTASKPQDAKTNGPLAGIIVIDLTRVLAGPYCTRTLRDMGARVIKVEPPGGDDARQVGPFTGDMSAYFLSLNCGKESIALDLKDNVDREIFTKLLAGADVLVENYRPGILEKLGFGWAHLQATFPKLVYAAISGFGATGPYANRPAYDMVVQAMGGVMSITGHDHDDPVRVGLSIGDIAAGLFAANAITAALVKRGKTGLGTRIDISMLDCQVAIMENAVARFHATGDIPARIGARHPASTPFDAFATSDGHIVVAASKNPVFKRFCEIIDTPELCAQADYIDNLKRTENHATLKVEIERALGKKTSATWLELLSKGDIPCGLINNIAALAEDPQIRARNMIVDVEGVGMGGMKISGNPIKIAGVEDATSRPPAPRLDQHRDQILIEIAKRNIG
ncbi:MAG: CoA transferase [Rhizobiales bacterium]|nr:CoA transferase [Hyphomicrobiales bacterium]